MGGGGGGKGGGGSGGMGGGAADDRAIADDDGVGGFRRGSLFLIPRSRNDDRLGQRRRHAIHKDQRYGHLFAALGTFLARTFLLFLLCLLRRAWGGKEGVRERIVKGREKEGTVFNRSVKMTTL